MVNGIITLAVKGGGITNDILLNMSLNFLGHRFGVD